MESTYRSGGFYVYPYYDCHCDFCGPYSGFFSIFRAYRAGAAYTADFCCNAGRYCIRGEARGVRRFDLDPSRSIRVACLRYGTREPVCCFRTAYRFLFRFYRSCLDMRLRTGKEFFCILPRRRCFACVRLLPRRRRVLGGIQLYSRQVPVCG